MSSSISQGYINSANSQSKTKLKTKTHPDSSKRLNDEETEANRETGCKRCNSSDRIIGKELCRICWIEGIYTVEQRGELQ